MCIIYNHSVESAIWQYFLSNKNVQCFSVMCDQLLDPQFKNQRDLWSCPGLTLYLNVLPVAKITFDLRYPSFADLLPISTMILSRGILLIHIWFQQQPDLVAGQRPRLQIRQPKFPHPEKQTSWLWAIIEPELQQIKQRPWRMKQLKTPQQLKR